MATFTNQASLSYGDRVTNSNTTTGQLLQVVTLSKRAVGGSYRRGGRAAYVISIVNSGTGEISGLTLSDDLGAYVLNGTTLYPLAYQADSIQYYSNGALQPVPTVTAGPPLSISGISVPAGGNVTLLYETAVTAYAPAQAESTITNTVTLSGGCLTEALTAQASLSAASGAELTLSKSLCPDTVTGCGEVNYTILLQNAGNVAVTAGDDAVIRDTFTPVLRGLQVTFNGTAWTQGTNYSYDGTTGAFATLAGQVTVPAATDTQDPDSGIWTTTPGVSVLKITGSI